MQPGHRHDAADRTADGEPEYEDRWSLLAAHVVLV
jgi:hypothetical protein